MLQLLLIDHFRNLYSKEQEPNPGKDSGIPNSSFNKAANASSAVDWRYADRAEFD